MNILKWTLLLTLIISIFFGCKTIYEVRSLEKNIDYYQGKEIPYKKDNKIKTTLQFENLARKNYRFYLEILNLSNQKILIEPEKFYMQVFTNYSRKKGYKNYAIVSSDKISKMSFWDADVLLKTTLLPKGNIGGYVLFPSWTGVENFKVVIQIGKTVHIYRFNQEEK